MSPPKAPLKICSYQGCNRKVKKGYCEEHKGFDNSFSNKKADPFYNMAIWRGSNPNAPFGKRGGLRERQLLSVPYCETCKEKGIIKDITGKGAGVADHIHRFRDAPTKAEQWRLFTDPDNLQSLCKTCHAQKTGAE